MKRVIVRLTLKPTSEGGRRRPILPPAYNCPVFFEEVTALWAHGYDCRVLVADHGAPILPGDTVEAIPIVFLFESDVLPHLSPGVRFTLWEGGTIGSGEVIRVEG